MEVEPVKKSRFTAMFSVMRLNEKNSCTDTGINLQGSSPGSRCDSYRWACLCHAVVSKGRTVDFYLFPRRNSKAAYRFLGKALKNMHGWQIPIFITD